MKWYIMALRKYAVFTGRSTRQEFWMYTLFSIIFSIVAQILDKLIGLGSDSPYVHTGWISGLYNLAVFIPALAVTVRRFHDIGKSGWMYARFLIAMMLIIFIGVGYAVYFIMQNGGMDALQNGDINPSVFSGSFVIALMATFILAFGLGIWILVLLCRESQPHPNKWGPNPSAVEVPGSIFGE